MSVRLLNVGVGKQTDDIMPASSTISPSLSSSNIAHSYSARTHAFIAPSNTRAVITAPRACTHTSTLPSLQYSFSLAAAWARDEPPSPTDQSDDADRLGYRCILSTQPLDLASSSRSSIDGHADNRSRWWTFVRPRQGSGTHDLTDRNRYLADDRQSQFLVSLRDGESNESPVPRSTVPSPAPFGPARSKIPGWDSPRRGRSRSRDEIRNNYARTGERQDAESGEKLTLGRSRKNRFRAFILSNIYVPLVRSWPCLFSQKFGMISSQLFRFINITFTTSALAVAIRIRLWETDYNLMGAVGSSP